MSFSLKSFCGLGFSISFVCLHPCVDCFVTGFLAAAFLLKCVLSCPSKNDKVHAGPIGESPNAPNSISVPPFCLFLFFLLLLCLQCAGGVEL